MDNTIYFSGVDMVDQTPVLDIKPYIPQYDNPGFVSQISSSQDLVDGRQSSEAPQSGPAVQQSNEALQVQLPTELNNLNVREMDGEENERREYALGAVAIESNHPVTEEPLYTRQIEWHV